MYISYYILLINNCKGLKMREKSIQKVISYLQKKYPKRKRLTQQQIADEFLMPRVEIKKLLEKGILSQELKLVAEHICAHPAK